MNKRLQTEMLGRMSRCTEETYYNMLGALPPRAMVNNGFLVGEISDHGGAGHAARYELYFTEDGFYFYGGKATLADFQMMLIPYDAPIPGKQYALTSATGTPSIANGNSWAESEVKHS